MARRQGDCLYNDERGQLKELEWRRGNSGTVESTGRATCIIAEYAVRVKEVDGSCNKEKRENDRQMDNLALFA